MLDRLRETVVAISSAPGAGPVGLVRLSGPRAVAIAEHLVAGAASWGKMVGSRRVAGEVCLDERARLPAAFYVFRAPHSYTREDLVEVHTVGSPVALEMVRKACLDYGAIPAEPGEFTARAFFNGAMDLAQAEAVASIIRAQSDTQLRASRRMMDGLLATKLSSLRDRLGELLALVEADIDFAEEPIDFITPHELHERLAAIAAEIETMRRQSPAAERVEQLPRILLLGPPNAGKSSLMNRLSGTRRAICAAVAGTTRDLLSAPIKLERGEAILLDSAGVDESEDHIIAQARELTLSEAERVDLVCLVLDATEVANGAAPQNLVRFAERVQLLDLPVVVVAANKIDLLSSESRSLALAVIQSLRRGRTLAVSARSGEGFDALRRCFTDVLGSSETTAQSEGILLTERQQSAMHSTSESLHRAAALAASVGATIDCADLLAFELREALDHLGAVTGAVTTEDLLTHVFANFCIGK